MEDEVMQQEAAAADPQAAQAPQAAQSPQGGKQVPPEIKEAYETFLYAAIKVASGENYDRMMQMAKSSDSPTQGFGRALHFVISAAKKATEKRGMTVPPELYLMKNGLVSQTGKLVASLLLKSGVEMDETDVQQGMEMAARQMANDDEMKRQGEGEQAQAAADPAAQDPAMAQQAAAQDPAMAQQAQAPMQQAAPAPMPQAAPAPASAPPVGGRLDQLINGGLLSQARGM